MDVTALETKPKRKRPQRIGGHNIFSGTVYHTVSRKQARLAIHGVNVKIMIGVIVIR